MLPSIMGTSQAAVAATPSETEASTSRGRQGVLDRAWDNVRRTFRDMAVRRGIKELNVGPDLPDDDVIDLEEQMRTCLEGRGGEVSARARAVELGRAYLALNETGRRRFLGIMARRFGPDREKVDAAIAAVHAAEAPSERDAAENELRLALEPSRVRLLTQFNGLPNGIKFLVDMRAEMLRFARDDRDLAGLERDLKRVLASWFDIGFLELKRITWEAPAALLEKFIDYEAVHEIQSWSDLKNRLDYDRRCYAFFHPSMPHEPLIFVEIALVNGMASDVRELLDETKPVGDPTNADAAIFYSISNAQRGLAGISFGNFLIKRVVDDLKRELPNLKTFATLSPIPGFGRWLQRRLDEPGEEDLLTEAEAKSLRELVEGDDDSGLLRAALAIENWHEREDLADALEQPLLRLAARYLYREKRDNGRAGDPVAHFHLSNGARMERLNWLGDRSPKGLRESAGIMINYLYRLGDIDQNHENYTADGTIAVSSAIRTLARR